MMRQSIYLLGCLLAVNACASGDGFSMQQGWSTAGKGTTGGEGGHEYRVANGEEFLKAMKFDSPKIIRVIAGIELKQDVRVTSDTTIIGGATNAMITGGGLNLRRVQNVIVQNLAIANAVDAINIEESHHIWIDHCDLSRCSDGLVDIKKASDFVTVSWSHFHDHHKTCLLGHSDKASVREMDKGHLRVTYHHNFFDGTQTRHPRVRFAEGVHVFNNYYRNNEYGVASLMDAGVIVEANVFENVGCPTLTAYGDSPDPGRLVARDNLLIRSGSVVTRGVVERSVLPYKYSPDPPNVIQALVATQAGPREKSDAPRQ